MFAHLPPVFIHSLHNCLVPFSDQLLDTEPPLLERDAGDADLKPVELPDREDPLENFLGDCDGRPLENFRSGGFDPDGVTLYARPCPRGLVDRPLPCTLGLCVMRGVPRDGARPVLDPLLLNERPLDVRERILRPLDDVDLE